jgi:hypothetical protein
VGLLTAVAARSTLAALAGAHFAAALVVLSDL